MTTRRRDAALRGAGRTVIDMTVFSGFEAADYLEQRLVGRGDPATELAGLAADVGHLPLALAQASAYITDQDYTCAQYRKLLRDQQCKLAELVPGADALPDEHADPIAATWRLSIEAANRHTPVGLAGSVLELACLLDPNGMLVLLITHQLAREYITTHAIHQTGGTVSVSEEGMVSALRVLHNLNLVDHDRHADIVRMHAMVQRAVRDSLTPIRLHTASHAAADTLLDAWPLSEPANTHTQALRANIISLHHNSRDTLYYPDVHAVLFRLGQSLADIGQVTAAIAHFQHLLERSHHHGPDHPDTLNARGNLARYRGEAGDVARAVTELEQLVADQERVQGSDHPHTITTRGNLARLRGRAGDVSGAVAEFEQLVADQERSLGPDHLDTLITSNTLEYWREYLRDEPTPR